LAKLVLENIRKVYGAGVVIPDLDLAISEGEFCVLVGPSGCGKSTLLRIIAGLEPVSSGRVLIDGVDVTDSEPPARGIAMVFQSYALYPHMSVERNMGFGLQIARMAKQQIIQRVGAAAASLRLDTLLHRKPRELSGGQRQRVAIGRAITRDPRIFLLDEPLSNLDAALRVGMRVEIARLHDKLGATMVYVTHDQVEAMTLADRIVVMNGGRIEQIGSPLELYHRPTNQFVAGFIGSPMMNFLKGKVTRATTNHARVTLDIGMSIDIPVERPLANGDVVVLGVRPEHLVIGAKDGWPTYAAKVAVVELLGSDSFLFIEAGSGMLVARGGDEAILRSGTRVTLSFPVQRCHLFDPSGRRISLAHPLPQPYQDGLTDIASGASV
jgi:multiple sugar transport system ATP-binding protein